MWKFGRTRVLGLMACAYLVGCTTSSIGLDLSVRGILHMTLTRASGTTVLVAGATVQDNGSIATNVELADDQVLSVNGTHLTPSFFNAFGHVSAELEADSAPSQYTVAFDNAGDVQTMLVTPPEDFTSTSPTLGDIVSTSGFTVTWSPSGEADVTVTIELSGKGPDGDDGDSDPDDVFKSFTDLADDGSSNISDSDLAGFNTGVINLIIRRIREVNQDIGFASGEVKVENVTAAALNLQ